MSSVALRRLDLDANDARAVLDEFSHFRVHAQIETWKALAVRREEIEKVPLRHQRDETAMRRQMREIGHHHAIGADQPGEMIDLFMRQLEEFVDQAEFKDQLQRRRVNRVTAEVAQEVRVFFQHGCFGAVS